MNDTIGAIITSLIVPILVATSTKKTWSAKRKFTVSLIFTFCITLLFNYPSLIQSLDYTHLKDQLLLTIVLVEANYKFWFKRSLVEEYVKSFLEEIENKNELNIKDNLVEPKPLTRERLTTILGDDVQFETGYQKDNLEATKEKV